MNSGSGLPAGHRVGQSNAGSPPAIRGRDPAAAPRRGPAGSAARSFASPPGFWRFLAAGLRASESVCLLAVVDSAGETPCKPGFKMAVARDGRLSGTVGGGVFEYEMVERARRMLSEDGETTLLVRREMGEAGDMLCGGNATMALLRLTPRSLAAIEAVLDGARRRTPGRLRLSPEGVAFRPGDPAETAPVFRQAAPADWSYEESLGSGDTVYIVGGGHVSLALSRTLAALDLRIVVMDERPDVETMRRNRYAHEKRIVRFDRVAGEIPAGEAAYVVIATPGHRADESALRQLAAKPLRYLGMLGSEGKVRAILEHLRADGFAEETLARLHAPIGLPIASHTPAEIAISIAAEIVQERNRAGVSRSRFDGA